MTSPLPPVNEPAMVAEPNFAWQMKMEQQLQTPQSNKVDESVRDWSKGVNDDVLMTPEKALEVVQNFVFLGFFKNINSKVVFTIPNSTGESF